MIGGSGGARSILRAWAARWITDSGPPVQGSVSTRWSGGRFSAAHPAALGDAIDGVGGGAGALLGAALYAPADT